jgi:hypothetical protein
VFNAQYGNRCYLTLNLKSSGRLNTLNIVHMTVLWSLNGSALSNCRLKHIANLTITVSITANKNLVTPCYRTKNPCKGFWKRNDFPPNVFVGIVFHHSLLLLEQIQTPGRRRNHRLLWAFPFPDYPHILLCGPCPFFWIINLCTQIESDKL